MRFLIDGYRRLLTHPRYGVWVILGTLLYILSPIDLSPDLFPLLGQIDDVALIVLLISAVSQWVGQQFQAATDVPGDSDTEAAQQTVDVQAIEVESVET